MDVQAVFNKYYQPGTPLYNSVWSHSRLVADKALQLAQAHPELEIDLDFVYEAAMIHDIGVFLTNAPSIYCTGDQPYICHGVLGAELMRADGYPRHALVCERHTGTGLTVADIIAQNLPLPHRDMCPVSLEEKLVCFADKFYSKSNPDREKPLDKVRKSVARYGEDSLRRFEEMAALFL
ncbi:HD domain-containing protein [Barnesiella viscericola]|uniref:HD domain-containing protein n=1 Tax=Barnesiella TaxID=397864 RepID=UPI000B372F00|nr:MULTISPECIES: HD domain-containing protein [Barnesiella]MCR8910812.1 HD domain-containing protein [Barnesiella sp. ET7]MDM8267695.1 HD domain-containing protein [Barnesiella viscericola]OUO97552.1 phosphohydrolase [Barnesiella sp. An22]HJB72484.1 HD domain-containing protein [Candidatus Barnesiella merdigallinarum]